MITTNVPKTHVANTMVVSMKTSLTDAQLPINAMNQVAHLKQDVMKLIRRNVASTMINAIHMIVTHIMVVPPLL